MISEWFEVLTHSVVCCNIRLFTLINAVINCSIVRGNKNCKIMTKVQKKRKQKGGMFPHPICIKRG
jgi:hypothetical protein